MDSVLLIVEIPIVDAPGAKMTRECFGEDMKKVLSRYKEIETLGENCWLIPLCNGVQSLSAIVGAAEGRGLRHRVLFFQEPPKWVSSSKTS